jgi:hypothetical protein
MRSLLQKGRNRFESRIELLDTQTVFRGTIQPIPETSVSIDSFAEPRLLLRVRNGEPVAAGQYIRDLSGRVLLVGTHDVHIWGNQELDRVHKLFQMTEQVVWSRESTAIDAITGLPASTGDVVLGSIWIAREIYGRREIDRALRIDEEINRVIAPTDVQLGDKLGDAMVRRKIEVFGLSLLELQ